MITESTIYWITRMSFVHGFALALSITFTTLAAPQRKCVPLKQSL